MSAVADKTRNRLTESDSKSNLKNYNYNKKRNKGLLGLNSIDQSSVPTVSVMLFNLKFQVPDN